MPSGHRFWVVPLDFANSFRESAPASDGVWLGGAVCGALRFAVRVKPGAKRDRVGGRWAGPGGDALVVAVAAPAVEGKANEALRRALAKAFGVRRCDVEIVAGERGRDKVVQLTATHEDAADRLAALLSDESI